jgi:hypothetical protein
MRMGHFYARKSHPEPKRSLNPRKIMSMRRMSGSSRRFFSLYSDDRKKRCVRKVEFACRLYDNVSALPSRPDALGRYRTFDHGWFLQVNI